MLQNRNILDIYDLLQIQYQNLLEVYHLLALDVRTIFDVTDASMVKN